MSGQSRKPWRGSLRARLVMLALAVLFPALGSTAVLLLSAYQHERHSLENQIGERARALGLVVDRQLGQNRVLLQALIATRALRDGDWQGVDATARLATGDADTWIVVVDSTGQQVVNTRLPPGAALPPPNPRRPAGVTWAEGRQEGVSVSNLFFGPAAKGPVIMATRGAVLTGGRQVDVSVVTTAGAFDRIWGGQKLPDNWTGVVLDGNNTVVTRSRDPAKYVGKSASPSMRENIRKRPDGVAETTTLDGIRSVTAWSQAPDYGWTFILAAPRQEIVGAARNSLVLAGVTGLLLMGLGVAMALVMARRIVLPVEALTDAAVRWEQGEAPPLAHSNISEIDALADALAHAAGRLAENQAELQALNASLEERVAERSRELEAATESLVQAQKLEAIGRLTGGVAHDFNNLLMAVSGNLDLLKRRLSDEKLLHYVAQAKQAAERGAKLTGQLLAFSRKQRLQPKAINVNDAIREAGGLLSSTLGGAVRVETVLDPVVWHALADATQLELVILNLVINARDAMPMGGVVTIETSNVVRHAASDKPESPPAGEFVMVAVADTGTGMSPEVAARVFEPFFTTKQIGQGSGLGLPQVLGLAKQLGGGVEIVTAPDEGAVVKVFLPRAESAEAAQDERAGDAAPVDLAGVRVLLADDDPDVRAVALALLTDMGCLVTETASGLAAVGAARSGAPFDAVLLDFAMPGMNGMEAAEQIALARPGLPILIMSGFADTEALAGRWPGPLLHKPFSAARLASQIARTVGEGGGRGLRLVT